jgi:hypothetical protein
MLLLDLDSKVKIIITNKYLSEKAPNNSTFYYKIYKY